MNIFRRFVLGSEEVESPKVEESSNSFAPSEVGSSSMHQPDPGAGSPQSSQNGRTSDGDCIIEILSSDDERGTCSVHDKEGKENAATSSSITRISNTGISKPTEDEMRVSAVITTVSDLKPTSSPLESTKSLSVTATDTSNDYGDDGDEGKENSAGVPRIDNNTSNATTSESDPSSPVKPANATIDLKTKSDSLVESTELQPVTTAEKLFPGIKRRRKRARDSQAVLPTALLSSSFSNRANNRKSSRRRIDSNEENSFAFLTKAQCNNEHQERNEKIEKPTESNLHDPSLKNSDLSKISKRSLHDASTETIHSPNEKQAIQEDSASPSSGEKSLKEDFSGNQLASTENINEPQTPVESKEAVAESPPKKIPQFMLPPELAPFNNPGVCDYGVIRTSRLRNRKKTNVQDDVLYQNIQGQRRCRATKDGKKMTGQSNTNRCLNCAEGVFKYCHAHRDLDDDQRAFWEQRRRRDTQIGSSSSSVRTNMATKGSSIKKYAAPHVRAKPLNNPMKKAKWRISSGSQMKCVEAVGDRFEQNEARRCVVLCPGKGRCSRNILTTQPGFCYGHASLMTATLKAAKEEIFQENSGTMRCTAVSKVGSKCKFKALDHCVFCVTHIKLPPETATPIAIVGFKKVKEECVDSIVNAESMGAEPTKGSPRKIGQNKSLTMGSNMASTEEMQSLGRISKLRGLKNLASNVIGKAKSHRKLFSKSNDNTIAKNDEIPKNIEFPRKIEFSTEQVEKATSFDNMCFNVYKSKRCWYKRAEGAILCHKCLVCQEQGTPFDHILNDDARGNESVLFSSKCVKFDRGEQCQNMALKGKILCTECLKSGPKYSESSEESGVDSTSDRMDSDSSSSATFSSGSDSEDSRISDDTNYDDYCMAYSHKEFFNMWKNWEKKTERMDEVEDSRLIKRANNTMSPTDTDGQVKAQYGRVLPHAMKKMIKILELRREDLFLDIGHGVGNTCLHASFCTGCDSRGIEVVSDRHEIADKFRGGMYAEHNCRDEPRPEVGKVDLRLGRLEDPHQKDFLTKGITRAYVNNFNGVFAERSSKNKDKWFLDDYISGIFASMAPGAIMVTFHPLNLGLDRDCANSLRSKHNLAKSDHASYYDIEKILLGKAFCTVKWNKRSGNTKDIFVYKYRRLHQPGHHDAVFLCSNPSCKIATNMVPIPATTTNEDGRCVINHCKCKFSPKNLRKRSSKQMSP